MADTLTYIENDERLQDRLFLNDGKGNFTKAINALPKMLSAKSVVAAADIDGDGDLDLFRWRQGQCQVNIPPTQEFYFAK